MGMKIKHIFLIVNHSITIVNQEIVQEAATRREFIGSSKNSNSKATHSSKTKSVFTGRELALIDAKSHEVKSCLARTVIRDAIILCFSAAPTSTSCLLPAYLRPIGYYSTRVSVGPAQNTSVLPWKDIFNN